MSTWWIEEFYQKFKFELWLLNIVDIATCIAIITNLTHEKHKLIQNIIMKESEYIVYYARDIIEGPWTSGEPIIATNPYHSLLYVMDIIKVPWQPGEKAIATCPYSAFWYAHSVIKNPWPPGEPVIATESKWAYLYAANVLRDRFLLGEPTIKNSSSKFAYETRFKITL